MSGLPRPTIDLRHVGLKVSVPGKASECLNAIALDLST